MNLSDFTYAVVELCFVSNTDSKSLVFTSSYLLCCNEIKCMLSSIHRVGILSKKRLSWYF